MPQPFAAAAGPWQALKPSDAAALLAPVAHPWWIAGGWALDLFIGTQTRPHKDLDIGIARNDAPRVLAALRDWEFFEAKNGALYPLGSAPRAEVNSLWGRPRGGLEWKLELLLDEIECSRWRFRRAHSISMLLGDLVRRDARGLHYLAPEVQLLYKARHARAEDEADFACVAPLLDPSARIWLESALEIVHPEHPWRRRLSAIR